MIHPLRPHAVRVLTIAAATAVLVTPAVADEPISSADLDCVIVLTTQINPGITPEESHQVLTTQGFTGVAECTGTVGGDTVTGTGEFSVDAAFIAEAGCLSAGGEGQFILRVPTTGGTKTVPGHFTFQNTTLSGDFQGTGEVLASEGDCFNTPRTAITARDTVHIGPP